MGGVMLANSEWAGGLRDRTLAVTAEQQKTVESELHATIECIIRSGFRYHGLGTLPIAGSGSASGG